MGSIALKITTFKLKIMNKELFNSESLITLLFILGYTTVSFTYYRIGVVGISEVFFMLLFFLTIFKWGKALLFSESYSYVDIIILTLMLCFTLGSIRSFFFFDYFAPNEIPRQIFALLYNFILIRTVHFLLDKQAYEQKMKDVMLVFLFIIFSFALIVTPMGNFYFIPTLMVRFQFLSVNPNQFALFILLLPFWILDSYESEDRIFFKRFSMVTCILIICIGVWTHTRALNLAWFGSMILAILYYKQLSFDLKLSSSIKKIFRFLFCFIVGYFLFRYWNFWLHSFVQQLEARIRFAFWLHSFKNVLFMSPIVGMGFGSFINAKTLDFSGTTEAHNIFVDVLNQGGFLGLIMMFYFLFKIVKQVYASRNILFLMALFSLLSFSLFHNMLRQPPFWIGLYWILYRTRHSTLKEEKTLYNSSKKYG